MPQKPKVLIIGAGMAGLSAGVYARRNGFSATIFEQQRRAGGLCQSWDRGSFSVNGCVHWLVGSSGRGEFTDLWYDLGLLPAVSFYHHDRLMTFRYPEGEVVLYADPDRLEAHLRSISPEDRADIQALCEAVRVIMRHDLPPMDEGEGLRALLGQVRMLFTHFSFIRHSLHWWRMTIREFADQLKHPLLKKVFARLWHEDMSMIALVMTLAFLARRNAGYPLGGSGKLIEPIVDRFLNLGGRLRLGQRVSKVIVEAGVARGVQLNNGEEIYGDYVISAMDGYTTLYGLLQGEYPDRRMVKAFDRLQPFPSLLLASFGVKRTFPDWTPGVMGVQWPLEPPMVIGSRRRAFMEVQAYTFDDSLAPPDHTLLTAHLEADFDFWRNKADHAPTYQACKRRTLDQIIAALERHLPGIERDMLMRDLATPITFHQYTGNHRGSYEGWLPTPEGLRMHVPKQLAGLDRFFMAGHWVEPGGGLPPAAMSGRRVIQAICKKERIPFRPEKRHDGRLFSRPSIQPQPTPS